MLRTILADRSRRLREIHGLTQRAAARKSGISVGEMNRIEGGKAGAVTIDTLGKLCLLYLVSPDYLLGFDRDEEHVRALLQHNGRLTYFVPTGNDGNPRKCADCDRLFVPGRIHTMAECILFMHEAGRSALFITQRCAVRYGLSVSSVRFIVSDTLRQLPWLSGNRDH